jgi:hypothetical protein
LMQTKHPVDDVLDYILEVSTVCSSIVCENLILTGTDVKRRRICHCNRRRPLCHLLCEQIQWPLPLSTSRLNSQDTNLILSELPTTIRALGPCIHLDDQSNSHPPFFLHNLIERTATHRISPPEDFGSTSHLCVRRGAHQPLATASAKKGISQRFTSKVTSPKVRFGATLEYEFRLRGKLAIILPS